MVLTNTTWARESARLAFFSVAMAERKDKTLLGLVEEANNALEGYLSAKKATPPSLGAMPPRPLLSPSPRPLSIMQECPEVPDRKSSVKGKGKEPQPPHPLDPYNTARSSPSEPDWQPSVDSMRQFRLAFPAVEAQLSKEQLPNLLAVFDVCSGRPLLDAADYRHITPLTLRCNLQLLKNLGAKQYLDDAVDRTQQSERIVMEHSL